MRISDWSSDVCSSDLDGKHILWLQLQELPSRVRGDAAGDITVPDDGIWTDSLTNRYADRIIQRLSAQIPGLHQSILGRHRSEERRVGKECVSTCSSRWSSLH